ncbi:histone deacetylase [Geoglobus ahangari]
MKPTGVFYHESFSRRSYLTVGTRLRDFPQAFEPLKSFENFRLIESPRVSEDLVLQVHTPELLEGVRADTLCSTAWHSAGGVVKAVEMVYEGELRNAFAYIGAGGHHAGRSYFWGYCCFNDVVLATRNLRNRHGDVRVAVIDTDAHHGDGTRELVKGDGNFLHYCICSSSYESNDGLKVDVSYFTTPYHSAVEGFGERVSEFEPDILIWYFGHDTHVGDYGDIGLTVADYTRIARFLKGLAARCCDDRLVVVLGGGSVPEIARESTLAIIRELLKP